MGSAVLRGYLAPAFWFALWIGAMAATPAQAQQSAFIVAPQSASASSAVKATSARRLAAAPAGCPDQGGLLDSITVPVGQPLDLGVQLRAPAPKGGATFQLRSNDPSIVAAGDPRQAFLPTVFVPEGQILSNTFRIFGIKVGATRLSLIARTPGFGSSSFPLGAWDLNRGGDDKFVDANNPLNTCRASEGSNDLSTDPNRLSQCGVTAKGIAADSVSKLLLRSVSGLPGTMCYQITSSSQFDQGQVTSAVLATQAAGGLQYGFSFLKAPESFGDTADSRDVELEFSFTPNIGNGNTTKFKAKTKIVRPPVVLVHGVWSSAGAWGSDYKKENAFRTTVAGDYSATNGASFSTNFPRIQDFVSRALKASRDKGYAVTQADVMGHSMGGLLTRLYIGSDKFKRPDNFGQGDVRRLISLDSPHSGSTFGNLVAALHQANPAGADKAVQAITKFAPAGGAVCDLAENSPALTGLNAATAIKAQAITGTGGPTGTPQAPARFFGGFLGFGNIEGELTRKVCVHRNSFFICDQEAFVFPQDIVDAFRFRQANDTIVSLISQQDGNCSNAGLAGINFGNIIHSGPSIVNGVLSSSAPAEQAYRLLDGPSSGFSDSFPGVASTGLGVACTVPGRGAVLDAQDYTAQCKAGGPLKPASAAQRRVALAVRTGGLRGQPIQQASDPRLQITSPAPGQVFAPGDTVNIVVSITAPLVANDIAVSVPGLGTLPGTNYDGSTYQASFTIPGYFAGPLVLTPSIIDTGGNAIDGVPVGVAVRPAMPPLAINFQQKNFRLTPLSVGSVEALQVLGTFGDGVTRDISAAAAGTIYSSSNPAIVSVDAEGIWQVNGTGISIITAINGGQQDYAVFVVEDTANPLPPQNDSAQLTVQQSGMRLDRTSGFFVQSLTVVNTQHVPIPGPLYLVLSGLPSGVNLVNQSGLTRNEIGRAHV